MAKIIWLSDLHFEVCSEDIINEFFEKLAKIVNARSDVIINGGDIAATAKDFNYFKNRLKRLCYSYGDIEGDLELRRRDRNADNCPYASNLSGRIYLYRETGIGDCKYGNFNREILNNSVKFGYLPYTAENYEEYARKAGRKVSDRLRKELNKQFYESHMAGVIILTHFPPFRELCYYDEKPMDDRFLPFNCWGVGGVMIKNFAKKHPNTPFYIFSGHTHSKAYFEHNNIKAYCARAEYGKPDIQGIIKINDVGAISFEDITLDEALRLIENAPEAEKVIDASSDSFSQNDESPL